MARELTGKNLFKDQQAYHLGFASFFFIFNLYLSHTSNNFQFFFANRILNSAIQSLRWDRYCAQKLRTIHLFNKMSHHQLSSVVTFTMGLAVQLFFDYRYETGGLYSLSYMTMRLTELFALSAFQWLIERKLFSSFQLNYPHTTYFLEYCVADISAYFGLQLGQYLHHWAYTPTQKPKQENHQKDSYQKKTHQSSEKEKPKSKPKPEPEPEPEPPPKNKNQQTDEGKNFIKLSKKESDFLSNEQLCAREQKDCCKAAVKAMELSGEALSKKNVKSQHRRLSLLFHPDKCHEQGCEERFVQVGLSRSVIFKKCL